MTTLTEKNETQNQENFFSLQICQVFWGFEQLSNTIVGGDVPVQNTCKLLDFILSLPEQKVLIKTLFSFFTPTTYGNLLLKYCNPTCCNSFILVGVLALGLHLGFAWSSHGADKDLLKACQHWNQDNTLLSEWAVTNFVRQNRCCLFLIYCNHNLLFHDSSSHFFCLVWPIYWRKKCTIMSLSLCFRQGCRSGYVINHFRFQKSLDYISSMKLLTSMIIKTSSLWYTRAHY